MRGYWSCNRLPSLEDLPLVCHETLWCFGVLLSPEECRLWLGRATNLVCWFTRQACARLSSELLDRWEEENHKLSARLGSGTRCCLRKHRAQDSTSSITKSRTRFPRALSAQFPVSRSSWEAKGNPSPDTLARQLTDSAFADSWWGPCSAQHSEPPSYGGGNRAPDTAPCPLIPGAALPPPPIVPPHFLITYSLGAQKRD